MRRATLLLLVVAALAGASRSAATLPAIPSGTSVGEGRPLKAYATITPQVHLFGDEITARLAVVADTKWVDPHRVRVSTDFAPYSPVQHTAPTTIRIGRFQQLTWTWTLRCITSACVPRLPPSERFHVFRFQQIHIDYLTTSGARAYGIDATWPRVEVVSQMSPSVAQSIVQTKHVNWQFHITPLAAPTYRISPDAVFWLALCAGVGMLLAASMFAWRWYRLMRPSRAGAPEGQAASPLERALAVLAWAHARGDETLERKALERVAGELDGDTPVPDVGELSRAARELAWSARTPADDDVETLSERARGTGRTDAPEGAAE